MPFGRRAKRQQVDGGDGWTVVTHTTTSNSTTSSSAYKSKSKKKTAIHSPDANSETSSPDPSLTPQSLLSEFTTMQSQFADTQLARALENRLAGRTWGVQNAVALGLGSFSREWERRKCAMWQLVLFVYVCGIIAPDRPSIPARDQKAVDGSAEAGDEVESEQEDQKEEKLGIKGGEELESDTKFASYAFDPVFSALDTSFLSLLHISIPAAESSTSLISPQTFLFSAFVDWFVLLPTYLSSPTADPILYIGNEILDDYGLYARGTGKEEKLEECNGVGKRFLDRRQEGMWELEEFERHGTALRGLVGYVKGNGDGDGKEEDKDEANRER